MVKKNVILTLLVAIAVVFCSSCAIVGNIATETDSEKVVPAEFDLRNTEGKVAVIVVMPAWIRTPVDLRVPLTDALNAMLAEKAGIDKSRLVSYRDVLKFRVALPRDKKDCVFEIAEKLYAKYVVVVQITDFDLSTFAEKDFYNGTMQTKTCLFDINGTKLWPKGSDDEGSCRDIVVGLESYKGTVKSAVETLSAATAHCVTRYFYNCKNVRFKIAEEQKKYDYYTW